MKTKLLLILLCSFGLGFIFKPPGASANPAAATALLDATSKPLHADSPDGQSTRAPVPACAEQEIHPFIQELPEAVSSAAKLVKLL